MAAKQQAREKPATLRAPPSLPVKDATLRDGGKRKTIVVDKTELTGKQ